MKKLITLLAVLFVLSPVMASINIATVINPFTLHRKVVEVGDPNAFNSGYILETRPMYDMLFNSEPLIGAKPFRPSGYETTLSSQLAEEGSETTLIVNSLTLPDDTTLDDANYGDLLILTVGEGDSEEKIAVTTLNETTLTFTIYSRGLEYGRWASSTDNMVQHLPGERVYVSNDDHFLYEQYYSLDGDETTTGDTSFAGDLTFTGANDFTGGTITVPAPSADADASTKKYVDDTILAGAPDGTESVKGVNELATQSEMSLGTLQGSTATNLVLQSQYATSTPNVDGLYLPVSESDGYLNQGWIDTSEDFSLTGSTTLSDAEITVLSIDSVTYTGEGADLNTLTTSSTTDASVLHYHPILCQIGVGTIAINTVTTQNISHTLGIAPNLFEISAFANTDDSNIDALGTSIGYATSISNESSAHGAIIDGTGEAVYAGSDASNIISLVDGSGNDDAVANLSAASATNFTLNWTTNVNEGGARYYIWKVCK